MIEADFSWAEDQYTEAEVIVTYTRAEVAAHMQAYFEQGGVVEKVPFEMPFEPKLRRAKGKMDREPRGRGLMPPDHEDRSEIKREMWLVVDEIIDHAPKTRDDARRHLWFLMKTRPTLRSLGLSETEFHWIINQCGIKR